MTTISLKRSKELVTLSGNHHEGLLIVWKIRQGIRLSVSNTRISNFVLHAYSNYLKPHFAEEEEVLFVRLSTDDELRAKAESEHVALNTIVVRLSDAAEVATADDLEAFAKLLERHIRFEERILFPYAEKVISNKDLSGIGNLLEAMHKQQGKLIWNDSFWVKG